MEQVWVVITALDAIQFENACCIAQVGWQKESRRFLKQLSEFAYAGMWEEKKYRDADRNREDADDKAMLWFDWSEKSHE